LISLASSTFSSFSFSFLQGGGARADPPLAFLFHSCSFSSTGKLLHSVQEMVGRGVRNTGQDRGLRNARQGRGANPRKGGIQATQLSPGDGTARAVGSPGDRAAKHARAVGSVNFPRHLLGRRLLPRSVPPVGAAARQQKPGNPLVKPRHRGFRGAGGDGGLGTGTQTS